MKLNPIKLPDRSRRGAAAALAAVIAVLLFQSPLRESWCHRSYDWLFTMRPPVDIHPTDVVIVEMDADSEAALGQLPVLAWDRSLHAELLRRLTATHAEVVAFDVLFRDSGQTPTAADNALVEAAQAHGRVIFGAKLSEQLTPTGEPGTRLERSLSHLIPVEKVGLVEESFGPDRFVRRHFSEHRRIPSFAWRVAELTMADPPPANGPTRWVNYYGPPGRTIPRLSYWRVLSNAVPAGLSLSNKVIFVGARTTIGPTAGSGTEYFPTPFGALMAGVELNATTYLNLRRRDWLTRSPEGIEPWALALISGVIGWWLYGLKPRRALAIAAILAVAAMPVAVTFFWLADFWFPWLFVSGAAIPAGVITSLLTRKIEPASSTATNSAGIHGRVLPPGAEAEASPLSVPIPDHTALRCIGRGGYGEVWLARDAIGSYHAVKLVYRKSFTSEAPFEREFRGMQKYTPISRNHPGWVHVLHVGRNETHHCFFYVMEVGDDESTGQEINPETYRPRSLATEIQTRKRLPPQECLELGIALADALDYLHGQLLVHRDIKPSNVIFVHGQPKFADVGLVTEVSNRDHNVSLVGTEGYIAPEGPGTAAADLYSLGKLLYEACTGRDRRAFPEVPESLVEGGDEELGQRLRAVISKACQDQPDLRYASAAALRDELMKLRAQD